MKRIILDTSFILSCVRKKIDFFEEISNSGLEILIPLQVIEEIKSIKNSESKTALLILKDKKYKSIDLKTKKVDEGILKFSEKNKGDIIATIDKELQMKIYARRMIIRGSKKLEII